MFLKNIYLLCTKFQLQQNAKSHAYHYYIRIYILRIYIYYILRVYIYYTYIILLLSNTKNIKPFLLKRLIQCYYKKNHFTIGTYLGNDAL